MERRPGPINRSWTKTIVAALLTGLVVLLLLFPASGVDSDPPVCRSMFFYVVPCEAWVAWAAAAGAAGLVALTMWANDRRRTTAGQ